MVREAKCECSERYEAEINSYALFQEIKEFFEAQTEKGLYNDIHVDFPYYIGLKSSKWYASKWYKCKECGCLWEFNYPDFPMRGFVRKFPDGVYRERED
jgi:hypothetical protein